MLRRLDWLSTQKKMVSREDTGATLLNSKRRLFHKPMRRNITEDTNLQNCLLAVSAL
jgi:hypothetical protein